MEILAGIAAILLYFFVSGSDTNSLQTNYKEIKVNSRFGHNETKIINNKRFTWVDEANVKLDEKNVIRDELGRPYFINSNGFIDIDTQKINLENN